MDMSKIEAEVDCCWDSESGPAPWPWRLDKTDSSFSLSLLPFIFKFAHSAHYPSPWHSMLTRYLFIFAQVHHEFRIPELQSISELYGFSIVYPDAAPPDISIPFMMLDLESEEHARILARRCILIKCVLWMSIHPLLTFCPRSIYEFYGQGSNYEELHAENRANSSRWSQYTDASFKFSITSYNHTIPQARQRELMEDFGYMNLNGIIDMKKPEVTFGCFEECTPL